MYESREIFYDSLSQLVNLIEIKLKKRQYQDVERYLKKIDNTFYKVFELRKANPRRFLSTIYSREIFEEMQSHFLYPNIVDPYAAVNFYHNEQPVFYLNDFFSNLYFQIWQLLRDEHSQLSTKVIESVLRKVKFLNAQKFVSGSNVDFLNLILRFNLFYSSEQENKSLPLFITSNRWYFEIVFHNESFYTDQLNLIDQYFLRTNRNVIDNNKLEAFKDLIDTTIRGYGIYPSPGLGFFYPLNLQDESNLKLHEKTLLLIHKLSKADKSRASFLKWEKQIDLLDNDLKNKSDEVSNHLSSLREYGKRSFLYRNLQKRVFLLGIYCVFKRRYAFVQYLITANSPLDSDAIQLNEDINPIHFKDIYYFFSIKYELEQESFSIWEGHHGFLYYFEQYIIIIIGSALRHTLRTSQIDLTTEAKILLGELNVQKTRQFYYDWQSINRENKATEEILLEVGFDQRFINKYLKPFIIKIRGEIYRYQKG